MPAFKPGQSGNPAGRPKGARSKLEEDFLKVMYDDWKENGADVVRAVRANDPSAYLKVVAQILPKEAKVEVEHSGAVGVRGLSETASWIAEALGDGADRAPSEPVPH